MYIEIATAMPEASVEEICEMILLQPVVQTEQKVEEKKPVKKTISQKPKPVEKKQEPVVVKKEEPKVQQKVYSPNVLKNATIVASNLGGKAEDFYEIVDALSFYQSPHDILGLIISDREAQK